MADIKEVEFIGERIGCSCLFLEREREREIVISLWNVEVHSQM